MLEKHLIVLSSDADAQYGSTHFWEDLQIRKGFIFNESQNSILFELKGTTARHYTALFDVVDMCSLSSSFRGIISIDLRQLADIRRIIGSQFLTEVQRRSKCETSFVFILPHSKGEDIKDVVKALDKTLLGNYCIWDYDKRKSPNKGKGAFLQ